MGGGLSLVSGLDHIFIAYPNHATGGVPISAMLRSYERDRPVLLTIEPWPLDGRPTSSFLADIANGSYDSIILREASAIRAMQQPILVRFGHEMDMTELYPWVEGNPTAFVSAYRHVVDLYRANGATNVLWVWVLQAAESLTPSPTTPATTTSTTSAHRSSNTRVGKQRSRTS